MNGVLQKAAPKQKSNPMLDQIVQQAEAQVPEKLKDQFLTIMTVGGKLMWSEQMTKEREEFDQVMQQSGGDVPQVVSHTVLKIISIIQNESQSEKPLEAVGLAAPIFMSHILQYVEAKHGMPVTKEMIDETGQLLQVNLLKMYGVKEEHLQELIKQRGQEQPEMAQSGPGGNAQGSMPEEDPEDELDEEEA